MALFPPDEGNREPPGLLGPLSDPDYAALMTDPPISPPTRPSVVRLRKCPICREYLTERGALANTCEQCNEFVPPEAA